MQEKEYSAKQKEMFVTLDKLNGLAEENGYEKSELLTDRFLIYRNSCRPGVFDLQDTLGADNMEFLTMAYDSLLGTLPDQKVLANWRERIDQPEWEFRRSVMESLKNLPDVARRGIRIVNDVYTAQNRQPRAHKTLKQRLLYAGYGLGRMLPLNIKKPLKELAMKFLIR